MADDHADSDGQSVTDVSEQPTTDERHAATETQQSTGERSRPDSDDRCEVDDRWVESPSDPLPEDLQAALERFLGAESVETLADWAAELRAHTGGAIGVDDLCHSDEATSHYGEVDGERYYFACFYDAVVLAALTDSRVAVHTESPASAVVEATVDDSGAVTATPSEAVFSLGISETATPSADGEPTHADVYAAVCPYVRAFPGAAAYEDWADRVPAATVALPLADAAGFTAALVE